jgi:arabinan endo-1,5-alpha-L-arabinosidase
VNIFDGGCGHETQPPPPDGRCGDLNQRPALLDPIDWVDGWPLLNGGRGPSDGPQHAPAAQPGDRTSYRTRLERDDRPGQQIAALSDEFNAALGQQWSWVRPPDPATYGLEGGTFRFDTQGADLFVDSNNASVLVEDAPNGDYIVETRVRLDVPAEGCCFNYAQAGLVIYGDDDNFIKLTNASIFNTRQTEFAKELSPVAPGYPRYGNTVVGPPAEWTYLRIAKRSRAGEEHYTAYTSRDGQRWTRGGTWTHDLGRGAQIGLVSMANPDFIANFDYVRVYRLRH